MALRSRNAANTDWIYPSGAPPDPIRFFEIFLPGTLAAGADVLEFQVPSFFTARTLKRVSARLNAASTSGSVQFRLELYTGAGQFVASLTSDTFTIAQGASTLADVTSFTNGLTASAGQFIRVYVVAAGTGAANLNIKVEY